MQMLSRGIGRRPPCAPKSGASRPKPVSQMPQNRFRQLTFDGYYYFHKRNPLASDWRSSDGFANSYEFELFGPDAICTYRNICVETDSYETCVDIGIADPAERYRRLRRYGGIPGIARTFHLARNRQFRHNWC